MIDIWVVLDKRGIVQSVEWVNLLLEKLHGKEWQKYLGRAFREIADFQIDETTKNIKWKKKQFTFHASKGQDDVQMIVLKEHSHNENLYRFALNQMGFGVQLYDRNACAIFMNQTSRDMSSMPSHIDVTGEHLLDLYALDEEISTVMTALRTKSPVINRFDQFKSKEGNSIVSVNTGYPVFENSELIGAVVFEKSLAVINDEIEKLESLKNTMKDKTAKRVSTFNGYSFSDIIGSNVEFLATVALAKTIAPQVCNILVVGATGTGKEIFAQSIHKASARKKSKFIAINCSAVPDTLIESMFFGTNKGSFTGSMDKPGLLEEAHGGTLFLDELNSMSLSMQSKLLRVIQEGNFRRVGGSKDIYIDVRFISSCNEDPAKLIDNNSLRRDLFYRLSTITIEIPPLRDRPDDIPELVQFYLTKSINRYVKTIDELSPQILSIFKNYHWPGNVRELFNVLDYILNTTEDNHVEVKHLPKHLQSSKMPSTIVESSKEDVDASVVSPKLSPLLGAPHLHAILAEVEKATIEKALIECRYNITKAAGLLGLSRQNLQYRIRKLEIASRTSP